VQGKELWVFQFKSRAINVEFMAVSLLRSVVSQGHTLANVVAAIGSRSTECLPVSDCFLTPCRVSVLHFDCPTIFLYSLRRLYPKRRLYFFLFSTTHCSLLRLIVRSGLDVPTFTTGRLHACHHARAPSGERWNCGR
jgi:hypothetical protein